MAKIESTFFDIGAMDALSMQDTPIHRLDPRSKVLTSLVFIVCIVSFGKHEISALLPFLVYPVVLIAVGNLTVGFILRKILVVAPFALLIGIFNPLLDREILMHLGPVGISGGWISLVSIMVRFLLTVAAALILIASTGFNAVCYALEKMGVPQVFVVQLLFLYRYIFVLVDETARMSRARSLRSFHGKGMGLRVFGSMAGHLLLRTLDRAQRVHLAMLCRGFDGAIRIFRPLKMGAREVLFVLGWSTFFVAMRLINGPQWLGEMITGLVK